MLSNNTSNISKEDMDFIQGVFNKVEYLEYLKIEEQIVMENCKKIKMRKRKMVIALILSVVLITILIKSTNSNLGVVLAISISVLALACFYEYREERIQYEY